MLHLEGMPMNRMLLAAVLAGVAHAASAQDVSSVYTDSDAEKTCITVDKAAEGDGDWVRQICSGFMGYPVIVDYGDARESVFYGFPPQGDDTLPWESFVSFNTSGKKVEWRVRKDGDKTVAFATINRWSVSDPENPDKQIEVLVVERVAQLGDRAGCAVGIVRATGDPAANEKARKIADEQAPDFACGDERTLVGEPMPTFLRGEN